MGREIRRVIPNWEHPMQECHHSPWNGGCGTAKRNDGKCYMPLYDNDFDSALEYWLAEYEQYKAGEHPYQDEIKDDRFWVWFNNGRPPDPEMYRPAWTEAEATWYQMYETVSEGTPVSPPFATKQELVDYLVEYGDYWDQMRGDGGWKRENAEGFVEREWAMSGMITPNGELKTPRDGI